MSGFRWTSRPMGGAGAVPAYVHRSRTATEDALEATANRARATALRRTGEYQASIRATSSGVGSPLPQAGAVERGANVGARKGPHMRGRASIRPAAVNGFGDAFATSFRSGGVR